MLGHLLLVWTGLAGCGSEVGLGVSPSGLDLGVLSPGQLATGSVVLTNHGDQTLEITELSLSDPEHFSVALLDPTLGAGEQEILTVGAYAEVSGRLEAELTVHTDGTEPLVIPLTARLAPEEVEPEPVGGPEGFAYDRTVVHSLDLELPEAAISSLRASPTEWVEGTVTFAGQTWTEVALRIKGSASFQSIDGKPAWKIKFDEYVPGQRFWGLERLTLNNEVWDATMMAETMSYWTWRDNGSPAPRTSYASVRLNGELLGLYAVLESMDDEFVDHNWPGSEGGLWEMTRSCDFTGDCSCFDLQETGDAYDPDGIVRGCEAAAIGTVDALKEAFDWEALIAFLAVEISVNHPDSYSWNLNNFFVYHDPLTDRLSLSPWGADSTFVYVYPPSHPNPDCEAIYLDVLSAGPVGWLMKFCQSQPACLADLRAKVREVSAWMEDADLVGEMERTRDLLDPHAALETHVNWNLADRDANVGCFLDWTARRPDVLREWATSL